MIKQPVRETNGGPSGPAMPSPEVQPTVVQRARSATE